LEELVELPLHRGQTVAAPHHRVEVELEVELAELGGEVVVVGEVFEDLEVVVGGAPARGDEEELLLGADPAHAGLDGAAFEHPLDGTQVGEELLGELAEALGVELVGDVVGAHAGGSLAQGDQSSRRSMARMAASAKRTAPRSRASIASPSSASARSGWTT